MSPIRKMIEFEATINVKIRDCSENATTSARSFHSRRYVNKNFFKFFFKDLMWWCIVIESLVVKSFVKNLSLFPNINGDKAVEMKALNHRCVNVILRLQTTQFEILFIQIIKLLSNSLETTTASHKTCLKSGTIKNIPVTGKMFMMNVHDEIFMIKCS